MKEAGYADELKILEEFKGTRNDWFVKEQKKRCRKATPKAQIKEGSSSQPKKRQKKVAKSLLVDELDEEELEVEMKAENVAEAETKVNVGVDIEKATGEKEGDDGDKDSSSSSDEEIDEIERERRIQPEIAKEKQLRKRKRQENEDEVYVPSPGEVIESQTPPSGGKKKAGARKKVVTPKMKKPLKILLKKKPTQEPSKPLSPPPEPTPHQSPIHLPLHQSPPRQPSPLHLSPPHLSPPHIHTATPSQEQPLLVSQQIFQTPPPSQPHVQTTPGSSGYKYFPNIPTEGISLEEIGDFNFASDVQVKNVEKKVDAVLVENKRLADLIAEEIEADQTEIDILKVKVAELEEEKARRDEQNKYRELKNKELEAAKAMKEHELYMINKVLENMLGKSIEQRFEEIEVEEVRAKRQAEIDAQMKDKGKSVESSVNAERSIVLSTDPESPIHNPFPISTISAIFDEDVLLEDLEDDDEEDDDEEKVFYASSHSDDDDNDDDDNQGGTGVKVTEASNERNVDDYMNDDANEVSKDADGEGENVNEVEKLILRIVPDVEEGEIRHTYTLDEVLKMFNVNEDELKFDFEEELNTFDINHQPEYEHKYVEDANVYDRVEVEDCFDEENVNEELLNFQL
ncbi:glutamic acid-rich protein-like [Helianthus annuus]|uniref:glutamic acid-rich protein-like n=1 Tax=Helianthus annuus TaxID=4232 RepID=UPI0016531CCE|nr:glutamic acid-rich protein-like [Helianthus annuus]